VPSIDIDRDAAHQAAQIELGLPSAVTGIFQGVLLFCLLGCDLLILYRLRITRPAVLGASWTSS